MNEGYLDEEDEVSIAYHEAGHAIIANHVGMLFEKVTILANEETVGRVILKNVDFDVENILFEDPDRVKIDNYLQALLAGPISEIKFGGHKEAHGVRHSNDFQITELLGQKMIASEKARAAYLHFIYALTEAHFTYEFEDEEDQDTYLWEQVCLLANELLKKKELTFKEMEALLQRA